MQKYYWICGTNEILYCIGSYCISFEVALQSKPAKGCFIGLFSILFGGFLVLVLVVVAVQFWVRCSGVVFLLVLESSAWISMLCNLHLASKRMHPQRMQNKPQQQKQKHQSIPQWHTAQYIVCSAISFDWTWKNLVILGMAATAHNQLSEGSFLFIFYCAAVAIPFCGCYLNMYANVANKLYCFRKATACQMLLKSK